jgi:hypothetical protein
MELYCQNLNLILFELFTKRLNSLFLLLILIYCLSSFNNMFQHPVPLVCLLIHFFNLRNATLYTFTLIFKIKKL